MTVEMSVEQRTQRVIEAILKAGGQINPLKIAQSCKEPTSFGYTVVNNMLCLYVDGRGPRKSANVGSLLYQVDRDASYPEPDSQMDSCCEHCPSADSSCKSEWRVKPVDGSFPDESGVDNNA